MASNARPGDYAPVKSNNKLLLVTISVAVAVAGCFAYIYLTSSSAIGAPSIKKREPRVLQPSAAKPANELPKEKRSDDRFDAPTLAVPPTRDSTAGKDEEFMTEQHQELLTSNLDKFTAHMHPESLITKLVASGVLTRDDKGDIEAKTTRVARVVTLIDILLLKPDSAFKKLIDALKATKQPALANLLTVAGSQTSGEAKQPVVGGAEPSESDFEVGRPVAETKKDFYDEHKDEAYPMNRIRRGRMVIINVYRVKGMAPRDGTNVDARNLKRLFEELHFTVTVHNDNDEDLTADGIRKLIQDMASDITDKHQCFILFILSHGETIEEGEVIYGTDAHPVFKSEIRDYLTDANCPSLAGKPRLIFYQACRGENTLLTDGPVADTSDYTEFMECYSCQPGYTSIRHPELGSRFVRCIVDVFSAHAHDTDVEELMNKVDEKLPQLVDGYTKWHQHATFDSMLALKLYFFPGIKQ